MARARAGCRVEAALVAEAGSAVAAALVRNK